MIKTIFLSSLALFLIVSVSGDVGVTPPDEQPFEIKYQDIRNVYDGDTFTLNCPQCKKGKVRVRLLGVDTPEIRGQCATEKQLAIEARDFLKEKLRKAEILIVIPNKSRLYDRYGRLLAVLKVDNQNVSELLIKNHLGRSYQSGSRHSWCR